MLAIAACGDDDDGGSMSMAGTGGDDMGQAGGGGAGRGGTGGGGEGGDGEGGEGGEGEAGEGGQGEAGGGGTGGMPSDPCEDVEDACDTAGTSCDGDTLVTCAENDDDCLVETRTDCTQGDTDECDPDADPPACVAVDPCADVEDPCETAGTSCDDDELVTCAENEDGCLVETRTDCTQGSTDLCDPDLDPPACAEDPCEGVANPCDTAGTSCDGNVTLVTCAANGEGCLVETETDCTEDGDNNYCAPASGETPAACADDPCRTEEGEPKDDVCVVDDTMCAEQVLVECEDDVDGCPIAQRTDCTTATGCTGGACNVCNPELEPPACDYDPCLGVTECLEAGMTCRDNAVVTCAADVNECLVETVVPCPDGETCDDSGDDPECVACFDDTGCETADPGDTSCDTAADALETCEDTDGDGCLNLVVESCGTEFTCNETTGCTYDGTQTCTAEEVLRASASYAGFDTDGASNDYSNYTCPGLVIPFQAAAEDLLFAVDVPPHTGTEVTLTNPTGFGSTGAWIMLLTTCTDATGAQAEASCRELSVSTVRYANETDATVRVYVLVDAESAAGTGTFGLSVDNHPLDCGDGKLEGSEQCDDGNIFEDDGCTPACQLEEGYQCTAASPSICTLRPEEPICANVMCDPLPDNAPGGAEVCCTADQQCGVAFDTVYGAGCIARDQEGVDDPACDDEQSFFSPLVSTLQGCCRPDDRCGLVSSTGAGCVERTELWRNMEDGFGVFLYDGPFEEQDCTYP